MLRHLIIALCLTLATSVASVGMCQVSRPDLNAMLDDATEALYFDEDYARAASLLEQVISIRKTAGALSDLGRAYAHIGKPREAAKAYVEAAQMNDTIAVDAFLNAIMTLESAGLDNEVDEVYDLAFAWHRSCPDWWDRMRLIYARRFNHYVDDRQINEALAVSREQLQLMDKKGVANQPRSRARVLSEIAQLAVNIGDYKIVLSYGPELAKELDRIPYDQRHTSSAAVSLLKPVAEYYYRSGDFARADSTFKSLIRIDTGFDNKASSLSCYACFLFEMGRIQEAVALMDEAAELYIKGGQPAQAVLMILDKASAAIKEKDWDATSIACSEAIELMESFKDNPNISQDIRYELCTKIANIYLITELTDYRDKAEEIYLDVLPFYKERDLKLDIVNVMNNLGTICHSKGRCDEALQYYTEASQILDLELYPDYLRQILNNKARLLHELGRNSEAVRIYKTLLDHLRGTMSREFIYMTDRERHEFWLNQYYIFDNIHGMPSSVTGIGELRYDAALCNKGILLDTSSSLREKILGSADSGLKKDFERLNSMRTQAHTAEEREAMVTLERDIQRRVMSMCGYTSGAQVRLSDVRARLGRSDRAVEIVRHEGHDKKYHYEALVAGPSGDVAIVPLPSQEYVESLDRSVIYKEPSALASAFWKPILRHCPEGGKVYVSPDGVYHKVAFEHLPLDGIPVSRARNIFRVSSTRSIASEQSAWNDIDYALWGGLDYNCDNEDVSDYSFTAADTYGAMRLGSVNSLWSYLPGTAREVDELGSLATEVGRNATVVTADEGREAVFKALSGHASGVIHIATHGFYIPASIKSVASDMLRSGLVLSGANNSWGDGATLCDGVNDGILTASEISRLDLSSTRLVVLSACESGLGDIEPEGVFGLPRAFKQSGVGSILMTLWPVADEATCNIMTAFYRGVFSGMPLRKALADACVAEGGDDPSIWSAFVIID